LVSVVTPVHNGAAYLADCIESVLAQTHDRFEYVICENHSTDETAAVVERYAREDSRIRVVRPERYLPQIANWNFAASRVSPASVYLKFVHADDTIAPTCLERMVEVAEAHPSVGIVGALRRRSDGEIDLDGIPPTTDVVPGRWLVRYQLLGGTYTTGPPSATLFRRESLPPSATLYDETYIHADDALSYQVLLAADFAYVGEPLTYMRLHADSTTAWCNRVGTWLPEHLRMALEVGRRILTDAELEHATGRWERAYGHMLLKWTLTLKLVRDRDVLRYHRQALAQLERAARTAGRPLAPTLRAYARVLARDRTPAENPVSEAESDTAEPVAEETPTLAAGPRA